MKFQSKPQIEDSRDQQECPDVLQILFPPLKSKLKHRRKLSERDKKIIEEIRRNPRITQKQIAETLGVDRTTVQRHCRWLQDHEYIFNDGSKVKPKWIAP